MKGREEETQPIPPSHYRRCSSVLTSLRSARPSGRGASVVDDRREDTERATRHERDKSRTVETEDLGSGESFRFIIALGLYLHLPDYSFLDSSVFQSVHETNRQSQRRKERVM